MASMEIGGIPAWYLRNFYGKADVMKNSFREKSIKSAVDQVAKSAGWLLITSKDNSVATLLETGKRLQRLLLKIRERNIAIHPMTQILEEAATRQIVQSALGISDNIQFILRTGYVKNYPQPVSLRRPVDSFLRKTTV
jgi:glycyl-tRNA synthetase beta subunit